MHQYYSSDLRPFLALMGLHY